LQRITSYFYDNNGNELSENVSYVRATIPNSQISLGVFDYDTGTTAVIDSKINLTNNEYDGFNRLTKVDIMKSGKRTITQYQYNGDDLRVKKTVMTSTNSYTPDVTCYYYDRQHVILETDASNNTKVRYVRGLDYIARLDGSNKVSLMLYNGHGDVVQTISETGNVENVYDYDIFGTAVPLALEQDVCNIRYAGEYYDNETGLYYLRSRYYNPMIGRFTIEDSYLGEDSNPLSLNLYTYTMNNPIRFIDPSGHVTQDVQGDVTYNPYTGKSYDSYGNLVGNTNTIKYDPRHYSEDVVQLQSMLRSNGYDIGVDGYFGKQTEEAVRAFQKANKLTVDGIVGQKTWAALLPAPERKSDNSKVPDLDE
jgi:RHS repeat-associated protein